ncbi:MAG: ADP-glyceromanno-heptose 6-epimerase [Halobacteriovorax sp.]|nr:ADP-glyceromanno-heptose 6-epimerase [Halobacteriovorax sp.]
MIIVTGAAGFIGSVLAAELNKAGYENLILVDRLRDGHKWKNLRGVVFSEYIHADDLFEPGVIEDLSEVEAIFHMGACSSTTETNVDYLMSNNVEFSKALFQWATQAKVPFIYASSAATYGEGELGYDDDHSKINQLRPMNAYGWSKQVFDQWALKQTETPPRWFGLKFFNVFGPNESHKGDMRSLVNKAYEQINSKGSVKLFKSHKEGFAHGEQLRDFVYVVDVVRAMLSMWKLESVNSSNNGIYNMGTGQERSFKDLVEASFKALNKPSSIEFIDMPEAIRGQYQYFTKAKMNKFYELIPSFKFMTLEDAVSDYICKYLHKNSKGYAD